MRRLPPLALLFAVGLALAAASPAAAARPQDAAPAAPAPPPEGAPDGARAERLRQARERWAAMTPEERTRIHSRLEAFRALPPERRAALRDRLQRSGGLEGLARRREQVQRMSGPERERLRLKIEAARRLEERVAASLPPETMEKVRALAASIFGPFERERLRRWVLGIAVGRALKSLAEEFATPAEREALEGRDPEKRIEARRALGDRIREQALAPGRERLAGLPAAEREREAARLLEEFLWKRVEPLLPEVWPEVRTRVERYLDTPPEERLLALLRVPPARLAEARERLREGLGRIQALLPEQRREALGALLQEVRREFGPPRPLFPVRRAR